MSKPEENIGKRGKQTHETHIIRMSYCPNSSKAYTHLTLGEKKFHVLGTEATKVGSDLVCSNNGVSLFPSPGSMAKGEDGAEGEVVLFGCSIALIQYSIMRWSGSVADDGFSLHPSLPPSARRPHPRQ